MNTNVSQIKLYFEDRRGDGSAQDYWHFMLGYYLPLMHFFLDAEKKQVESDHHRFLIHNCGPIMNKLIKESLSEFKINYAFMDNLKLVGVVFDPPGGRSFRQRVCRKLLKIFGRNTNTGYTCTNIKRDVVMPRWDIKLGDAPHPASFLCTIVTLRDSLQRKLATASCCPKENVERKFLLIKRSPQPSFYNRGKDEWSGYGAGRRALLGLEEACEKLNSEGIGSIIYEPGAHNMACQINHFFHCSGLIGVRGAEFVNMFWMRPDAKVILINSAWFKKRSTDIPPQRKLASLLALNYHEIEHNNEESPVLDEYLLGLLIRIIS